MPSSTSRRYTPDRFRSLSKPEDDLMEDITHAIPGGPKSTTSHSLSLGPSDGSLLDYFDLPSPPSTPHHPTHSLSYSSLDGFPSPTSSPGLAAYSSPSSFSSLSSNTSPSTTPPSTSAPRWPTASQRLHHHHHRLPTRPRSRSTSSASSASSSSTAGITGDIEMGGTTTRGGLLSRSGSMTTTPPGPSVRPARRTAYYPPNSSRTVDRARAYMNRGPHYVPNWTPMSSLPRHVQLQIEERMVRFSTQ
ncbi:hypothetical protein C8A00DRAFT_46502 [Chaetomidium leptoderma]|uniref:Uncharacterized protein n=1 Tax=Chaetomidium leptoderma TaxID=669021 RepID=A0AAN6ZSA5_9PEZI|nr:hypothetical protein C8A00DRAFT_46502 [Chaetomidium leptoderma]